MVAKHDRDLDSRHQALLARLREQVPAGRLAVAFSGGVDSTLLLGLALEALGAERVLAVTAVSASLARDELEACRRLARELGARLVEVETRELQREGYRQNGPDRCYHCKSELFAVLDEAVAARERVSAVAYGANADDAGDHRPGMQAARERGVLAPLLEAGLTKADVRALSRRLGLPTWDKPAHPCLASRLPYGERVTPEKLSQVERAEAALRRLGLRELRVRHHGETARLEVLPEDMPGLLAPGVREQVTGSLRALGYRYVVLDLEGFRSGRLNEALKSLPVVAP